jgi:hypothetical protein
MFSVDYDGKNGIIRCTAGGFKSVADLEEHSKAVNEAMQRSYRDFGRVAMLVKDTGGIVQSAEVLEAAKVDMQRHRPEDRVACVVTSPLVKLQAERSFSSDRYKIFTSEAEAQAWLIREAPIGEGGVRRSIPA